MNRRFFHRMLGSASMAALLIFSGCAPSQPPEPPALPFISEAMNHNQTILADASASFEDWVEIHNPGDTPLALDGYTLSDSEKSPRKWEFPAGTVLAPGEYRVVFCSGKTEVPPEELHASFRISGSGEPILLCDPAGRIISRLDVPRLPDDVSFGYAAENLEQPLYYPEPTPGRENGPDGLKDMKDKPIPHYDLRISEYTTSNNYAFYDRDGDCPTWVEIQNFGTVPVELSGMFLSDDPDNLNKWAFPQGLVLEPGAYQLVLTSGKDRWEAGELHADFRLGGSDQWLILSDSEERPVDQTELVKLEGNVSYGLVPDGSSWAYFPRPTPGKENSSHAFGSLREGMSLPLREVWINEVMSVSSGKKSAVYAQDWLELVNGSDHPVTLTGWGLSDSENAFQKFVFPETELAPGEYLLLTANSLQPDGEHPYQLPFALNAAGETLYLTRPDGTLCDRFQTGRQKNGISSGRAVGTEDIRLFFPEPTPGAANSAGIPGYTAIPVFSREALYLEPGETVEILGNGEIRYTLDGSAPRQDSPLYTAPIPITKNVTIRAAAFEEGLLCGGIASHTYLVDTPHEISVVCLSTAPGYLFDPQTGIYSFGPRYNPNFPHYGANFWKDLEVPVHFEFYEPGGQPGIFFDAGLKIFGQFSRAIPQKSFSVHLRETYGPNEIHYPFFPDNPVTEYHSILLRTSGQDWSNSKIRDALAHHLVKGEMDLDIMDYRPAALYINGQYWGLYNIRDKINEEYLQTHHGIDPKQVDIIRADYLLQAGNKDAYDEMMHFVRTHDLTNDENYDQLLTMVDDEEIMNYWITETFFANTDTGNIKIYRERREGARWRLLLYDLDWALFPTSYQKNMLREALDPEGHGYDNLFSTELLRGLLANARGRQKFIGLYAHYLNTTFAPERTAAVVQEMADAIRLEIPRQYERWECPSVNGWEKEIAFLQRALEYRRTKSIEDLQSVFHLSNQEIQTLFPNG